ncbi:MAG: hypothetical protein WDM77_15320 [Steroidobacteraceae bacterium]
MTQAMHQILVIEDDASIREVLRALLGSVGFRVIEAATAARADIEARAHKPICCWWTWVCRMAMV